MSTIRTSFTYLGTRVTFTASVGNMTLLQEHSDDSQAEHEVVVLCNPDGAPRGTALKAEVHTTQTPLHRAFSCYIFDEDAHLLLTRRAVGKKTWPGVWTNSVCGHPAPGESDEAAIYRRLAEELGASADAYPHPVLPFFSYEAVDASGIMEREFCPVYRLDIQRQQLGLDPNPDEVAQVLWVPFDKVVRTATLIPELLSPWMVEQLSQWPDTV